MWQPQPAGQLWPQRETFLTISKEPPRHATLFLTNEMSYYPNQQLASNLLTISIVQQLLKVPGSHTHIASGDAVSRNRD